METFEIGQQENVVQPMREVKFAPPGLIFAFVVITFLLGVFFFPKQEILRRVENQKIADRAAKEYVDNLIQLYPHNKSLKLVRADQNIKLGDIAKAVKEIVPFVVARPATKEEWQAFWLYYQIVRIETYATPEVSPMRGVGLKKMQEMLGQLINHITSGSQLVVLANDAIALGKPDMALLLYQRMLNVDLDENVRVYVKAAKFALSQGDYRLSSELYFIAKNEATTVEDKRMYLIAGLKSLQSGDLLVEAVNAAEKHVGDLSDDRATLIFLTKLALAANKPELAEKYVKKAITTK